MFAIVLTHAADKTKKLVIESKIENWVESLLLLFLVANMRQQLC